MTSQNKTTHQYIMNRIPILIFIPILFYMTQPIVARSLHHLFRLIHLTRCCSPSSSSWLCCVVSSSGATTDQWYADCWRVKCRTTYTHVNRTSTWWFIRGVIYLNWSFVDAFTAMFTVVVVFYPLCGTLPPVWYTTPSVVHYPQCGTLPPVWYTTPPVWYTTLHVVQLHLFTFSSLVQ